MSDDEEEIQEGEDFLEEIVDTTKENRPAEGTRKNYHSKITMLRKFIRQNYGVEIDNNFDALIVYLNDNPIVVDKFVACYSYKDPVTRSGIRAKSTVTGYVSSVKYLYKEAADPDLRQIPEVIETSLKSYVSGFVKTRAKKQEGGQTKQLEGKRPLTDGAYRTIAAKAMQSCGKSSAFAHLYGLLAWNVVQRAVTIGCIHTSSIYWTSANIFDTQSSRRRFVHCQSTKSMKMTTNKIN